LKNLIKISVITTVYNAETYLRQAVESAIDLEEVGEVILVEDKSPDNALALCRELEKEYEKVRVFQHPNGENRGAGASRNLGIKKSTCDFIAFLDADDFYLPNRFKSEQKLFEDPEVDAVYGGSGFYFQDKQARSEDLTSFEQKVDQENLLYEMLILTGKFHTNTITIRKTLLEKTGVFNANLKLHQDTHLWLRLAHFGNLVPGQIDRAVSMRRVHSENRIAGKNAKSRALFHKANFDSFKNYKNVDKRAMKILINRYVFKVSKNKPEALRLYLKIFSANPELLRCYF
jgi:glycosyltransferase involved in cell wall biosynthesis